MVFLLCILLMVFELVGCVSPSPKPAVSPFVSPISVLPSPVAKVTSRAGVAFTMDPVRGGDTRVTGTGPAGLPIRIIDLSQAGTQIGSGVIDKTGHFKISVAVPIIGGNRIGIQIGELAGTLFRYDDFQRGPGYRDIPMIGIVFTSTLASKN
jgi:hypothetical protein